ncbi:hypothetical protein AWZ03_004152 [Drosophila navojoa]|uniref:Cytochrome b5 heme-binding domain-containing protein n=1 Tax=Drosophila navojoa TaxID=7232 RepID=A0A484BKW1_DRONA|nr:hypothetical protein AWZ03_004152 [Drosophila navojoa]
MAASSNSCSSNSSSSSSSSSSAVTMLQQQQQQQQQQLQQQTNIGPMAASVIQPDYLLNNDRGLFKRFRQAVSGQSKSNQDPAKPPELPPFPFTRMTSNQLLEYDGTRHDGRILIAFKDKIYDVTAGHEEFSSQGVLGCVAGKNFSGYLERALQPRETIVEYINRWDTLLDKNYPMVGLLIDEEEEMQDNSLVNSETGIMEESLEDINRDNDNDNEFGNITYIDSSDVQVIESTFEDDDVNETVIKVPVGKVQMKDVPEEAQIHDTSETPLGAAISEKTC